MKSVFFRHEDMKNMFFSQEDICCCRQGFNKNLTPQSVYGRKSYRI